MQLTSSLVLSTSTNLQLSIRTTVTYTCYGVITVILVLAIFYLLSVTTSHSIHIPLPIYHSTHPTTTPDAMEDPTRGQKSPSPLPERRSGEIGRTSPRPETDAQQDSVKKDDDQQIALSKPAITTQAASSTNIHNASARPGVSRIQTGTGISGADRLQIPPLQEGEVEVEPEVERPVSFAPFFTLVNDLGDGSTGGGTYHPNKVHYLFSDDDASNLLTEALIRSASPSTHDHIRQSSSMNESGTSGSGVHMGMTSSSSSSATFRRDGSLRENPKSGNRGKGRGKEKGAITKEREERILIVDLHPTSANDSFTIQNISSLSPSWQALSAEVANAPTWDGADPSDSVVPPGLMLRIEGMSVPGSSEREKDVGLGILAGGSGEREKEKDKEIGDEELQALLEGFDHKMRLLRRVVGARSRLNSRESGRSEGEVG